MKLPRMATASILLPLASVLLPGLWCIAELDVPHGAWPLAYLAIVLGGVVVGVAARMRWPDHLWISSLVCVAATAALLIGFGRSDVVADQYRDQDDWQITTISSRFGRVPLHRFMKSETTFVSIPLSPAEEAHGHTTIDESQSRSDEWYWHGQEVTEKRWHELAGADRGEERFGIGMPGACLFFTLWIAAPVFCIWATRTAARRNNPERRGVGKPRSPSMSGRADVRPRQSREGGKVSDSSGN